MDKLFTKLKNLSRQLVENHVDHLIIVKQKGSDVRHAGYHAAYDGDITLLTRVLGILLVPEIKESQEEVYAAFYSALVDVEKTIHPDADLDSIRNYPSVH